MSYPYGPPQYPQSPYPQPPFAAQVSPQDEQNIDLLGILFYVYAGFVGLMALAMGGIALVPMVLVAAAAGQKGAAPAAAFGGLLLVLFAFVGVLFVVKAILLIFAGRSLRRRSGYVLAMIAACLALINFPFGTALGVATFVILQKPGVKARFRA